MIKRSEMQKEASMYTTPRIGVLGSHSALEIMDGAKDEEFETIVFCQKGREIPYQRFNRIADQIKIVNKFKEMASSSILALSKSFFAISPFLIFSSDFVL